ncbi:MAG: hypothetical protein NVSMB56_10910 [Pyrinomonadaceae bacterium]
MFEQEHTERNNARQLMQLAEQKSFADFDCHALKLLTAIEAEPSVERMTALSRNQIMPDFSFFDK